MEIKIERLPALAECELSCSVCNSYFKANEQLIRIDNKHYCISDGFKQLETLKTSIYELVGKICIPIDKLKDGYVYQINARNANIGVYVEARKSFKIRRVKFGDIYIFEEIHWDADENYGTAKPFNELEKLPVNIDSDEKLISYLERLEDFYRYNHIVPNWSREDI